MVPERDVAKLPLCRPQNMAATISTIHKNFKSIFMLKRMEHHSPLIYKHLHDFYLEFIFFNRLLKASCLLIYYWDMRFC
jgi:hypothetical protein